MKNIAPEIYELLETTEFTELFRISKNCVRSA